MQKLVSRILSSDTQRPSGVYEWQMPMPSVLPTPLPPRESRRPAPLEAQDASYLAASARIASLSVSSMRPPWMVAVSAGETRGDARLTVQGRREDARPGGLTAGRGARTPDHPGHRC